jgi:antigen flippase
LAQGNQLFLLGVTVGSAGLSSGVIRRLAALGQDEESRAQRDDLLATSYVIHLVASLLFVVVVLLLAKPLTGVVFGPGGLVVMLVASVVAVPLNTMASGHIESVMFGLGRYDLYTRAAAAATVIGLPVFVVCALAWGLTGAFWGAALAGGIYFVTYAVEVRRLVAWGALFRLRLSWESARGLLTYSAATLLTMTAGVLAALAVRGGVIHHGGSAANGLYQVPVALTAYYTPFLTNALWARLYPAASASEAAAGAELAAALRVVTLGSAGFTIGLLVTAEIVIRVAYSSTFMPALDLLPLQFLGDVPFFALSAAGMFLLAIGKLRAYVISWLAFYGLWVIGALLWVPAHGASGAAVAYAVAAWVVGSVVVIATLTQHAVPGWPRLLGFVLGCGGAVAAMAAVVYGGHPVVWRVPLALVLLIVVLAAVRRQVRRRPDQPASPS